MLVYPQTIEFSRNCHRQIGLFLLVEALAPSPSEHESVLGNAYCGYAILQIVGLHNTIWVYRVVPLSQVVYPYSEDDQHLLSLSKVPSFQIGAFDTLDTSLSSVIVTPRTLLASFSKQAAFQSRQLFKTHLIKILFCRLMKQNIMLMFLLELF